MTLNEHLEQIGGCGDGNCKVYIRPGMHTNGGCRCLRHDPMKAERVISAYRMELDRMTSQLAVAEAKGWRDAVSCLQYCEANWYQDQRSDEGRNALVDATHALISELVTCSSGDWLGTEWKSAQEWIAEVTALRAQLAERNNPDGFEIAGYRVTGIYEGREGTDVVDSLHRAEEIAEVMTDCRIEPLYARITLKEAEQ